MALNSIMLDLVGQNIKPGYKIASMGYPDIISPPDVYKNYINGDDSKLEYLNESKAVCRRHGIPLHAVPDAHSYFGLMGAELDVFDITAERGGEIFCDLNYTLDPIHQNKYDFVMDVGTLEHCFNIAQAIKNMASFLRVGGVILHENPFIMPNHGFYCPQPTFYEDFYTENGFEIIDIMIITGSDRTEKSMHHAPRVKRFALKAYEDKTTIFCIAQRKQLKPFTWPTQTKYKKVLDNSVVTIPADRVLVESAAD